MGDLRQNLLRQTLQKELNKAKKLEAQGDVKKAGIHYIRAGAIYRRIAYISPVKKAQNIFHVASQYESLGKTIQKKELIKGDLETYTDVISNLIISQKPDIEWDNIGGLGEAKKIIKEAVILPFIKEKPPYLRVPRTILLYGPPGTGKTLLAKAASNTLDATFFEARLPSLLSKYFGESSKLVNALFNKAREMQPSLIFMDELDIVAVSRETGIDESTRRVLGQLLTEIEGFNTSREDKILIMGATNKPWDLDDAVISRFQRKIYTPLPDFDARKSIFEIHLEGISLTKSELASLAKKTEGFSGRDIASVCQEAILTMVREQNPDLDKLTAQQLNNYSLKSRSLTPEDFEKAIAKIKPSKVDTEKYKKWGEEFGA